MTNDSLLAPLLSAVASQIPRLGQPETLGVPDAAKPAVVAALAAKHAGPVVVVTASPRHAAELLETLPTWLPYLQAGRVIPLPARETAPYERQSPDPDVIEARLAALDALARRDPIVITDADAVTQATLPAGVSGASVERGERISRDGVIAALESSATSARRSSCSPPTTPSAAASSISGRPATTPPCALSSSATTSRACAASIRPPSVRWSRSIAYSSASLARPAPNPAPAQASCSARFAATTTTQKPRRSPRRCASSPTGAIRSAATSGPRSSPAATSGRTSPAARC